MEIFDIFAKIRIPLHRNHHIYMERCLQLAQKGFGYTYPNPMVGAVVVNKGVIIGEGWHQKAGKPHAEVNAINKLPINNKRKKVNVFVFRTNKSGKVLTMAKPCDNCIKYIKQNLIIKGYRLNNIFYTDFNGYIMKLE